MKWTCLFVLCLCLVFAVQAQLPQYTEVSCTVVKNDYALAIHPNCSGDTAPITSGDTKKREEGGVVVLEEEMAILEERALTNVYSCQTDPDSATGFGQIQVSFTGPNGTVTTVVCDTYNCQFQLPIPDVQNWLNTYPVGTVIPTCYYQTLTPVVAFISSAGVCSFQGTLVDNAGVLSCDCADSSTGADCSKAPTTPPRESDAASLIISCFFAVVVLFALLV